MAQKTLEKTYQPNLKTAYFKHIRPNLQKELGLKNIHQVPELEKIILNTGLGQAKTDKQVMEVATQTLSKISGQKPKVTLARMSVASFKLREGNPIGMMVTLRGERMYEFLERLINFVLPRMRDFRGVSFKSFDKNGHYSLGFRDQSIFPELTFEETRLAHGLQVTLVFRSSSPATSEKLLSHFGFKFEKRGTHG